MSVSVSSEGGNRIPQLEIYASACPASNTVQLAKAGYPPREGNARWT